MEKADQAEKKAWKANRTPESHRGRRFWSSPIALWGFFQQTSWRTLWLHIVQKVREIMDTFPQLLELYWVKDEDDCDQIQMSTHLSNTETAQYFLQANPQIPIKKWEGEREDYLRSDKQHQG